MAEERTNRIQIIDDLIGNLFIHNPRFDTDEGQDEKVSQWILHDNVSLTLSFIFPQVYLKAIEILDSQCIHVYKYKKDDNEKDEDDKLNDDMNDCLVLIDSIDDNGKKVPNVVDLGQWFCSCSTFKTAFDQAVIDEFISEHDENKSFGYRKDLIFQFLDEDDYKIPICEHLLAYHILQQHREKFETSPPYTIHSLDLHQWLDIHSTLITPK